jgi:hypothetical protein
LLAIALAVPGLTAAQSPEELFERGNSAYDHGSFAEAVEAYESIVRFGFRDPRVEYNLGNAYFKLGDLGRAVLHYERARRLSPTDPDIRANLDLARSRRFDRVEEQEVAFVVQAVRAVQDRLGPDRQALAFLGLVWAVTALLTWIAIRPRGLTPAAGWTLAALLVTAGALGVSWWMTWHRVEGSRMAVVLEDTVEVLAGPGANNATLFTVHEGLTLEVRSQRSEWIQVSLPNGFNGWIPASAVGVV